MKHEVSPVSLMGLEDFAGKRNEAGKAHIDTVSDISIELGVKLGKSSITLGDVKQLKVGDVLEVEKNLGHKVDVYLSNMKVGIGEAIVMDGNSDHMIDMTTLSSRFTVWCARLRCILYDEKTRKQQF